MLWEDLTGGVLTSSVISDRLLRLPGPAFVGCYAGIMTVTLHLDGAVAEALAVEAARRGQTTDQLAADLLAAQLTRVPRRRLAFAAVGASTSGRGAAEADEMLAEGFGRD
jgi:hypothetical protein